MPGHSIEGSRTFYRLNEVLVWLETAGYREQETWTKSQRIEVEEGII